MLLLNKAFDIMEDLDDANDKVLHEDMDRVRRIVWAMGLEPAVVHLNTSIHPYHDHVKVAIRQMHYLLEFAA